jgi:hypothetical protein
MSEQSQQAQRALTRGIERAFRGALRALDRLGADPPAATWTDRDTTAVKHYRIGCAMLEADLAGLAGEIVLVPDDPDGLTRLPKKDLPPAAIRGARDAWGQACADFLEDPEDSALGRAITRLVEEVRPAIAETIARELVRADVKRILRELNGP